VPDKPDDFSSSTYQESILSEVVKDSGYAAVLLKDTCANSVGIPLFNLFAAMKWIASYGNEAGINGNKIAIIGLQLGATLASVLCQMAVSNNSPDVSLLILINPKFYVSEKTICHHPLEGKSHSGLSEGEWLNMKSIYNLPLDSQINELNGLPPTLVQLSAKSGHHCELEHYCAKLQSAGTAVTYLSYEENNDESQDDGLLSNHRLLKRTATELKRFK
jgi:acetyl esterase/lipase